MKKIIYSLFILALIMPMTSCEDDGNSNQQLRTIAQIASDNANFSILAEALLITNLEDTFNQPGNFTVFAPTDDKFEAFLSANNFATIYDVPVPLLTEVLKNHVLGQTYSSFELSTGYYKTLAVGSASATNTISMYIDLTSGVKINGGSANGGANVVIANANIQASNGVIHVVDNVINLPTVVNHAIANPDFTSLVGALTSSGQPDFPTILSGTGPFTVFAPTNAAFTSLNAELSSSGGIAGLPASTLTNVLQYHVASGNVLSTSLTNNMMVTALNGSSLTINLTGGAKITDGQGRVSNIVATDVQASNGVIHVIDKVILP